MSTYLRVVSSLKSIIPLRVRWALSILRKRVRWALSILRKGVPPESLPPVPSMLTDGEKRFLAELTRELAPRDGAIADLGCWMGSSTIALAEGLRDRSGGPGAARVLTHDLFRCYNARMGDSSPVVKPFGIYEVGEDFAPEARRYIRDRAGELVEIRKVDLSSYEWTEGPISLLHVDCMKSLDIARQVTRSFYPSMFPGSILIHQDYKHYYTSWIHIIQYRMRSHFEMLRSVVGGCTVAFLCVSPVSPTEAAGVLDGEPSDDEVERCFDWSKGLVGDLVENVAAAHVMEYIHLGRIGRAREIVMKYCAAGLAERSDMPMAIDRLISVESKVAPRQYAELVKPEIRQRLVDLFSESAPLS
jgi:hypothetical protein